MFNIAIIGAGQLGSRHLQGLCNLRQECEIDVVDPSTTSLELAHRRQLEIAANPAVRAVRYHTSIDRLPAQLDLAVVATSADVRYAVMDTLLAHSRVRLMLAEKVLFQRPDEYAIAQELLARRGVKTWVNCPRRAYPIYQKLREYFAHDRLSYAQVMGDNWGLGCNGVHFLDLFSMLAGEQLDRLDTTGLDHRLIPSTRKGFIEYTGFCRGSFVGGARFEIASLFGDASRLLLTFRSANRTCFVDETAGCAFLLDGATGAGWVREEFHAPYLSELIPGLVGQMLDTETSPLPTFAESVAYHVPFIKAMADHAAACDDAYSPDCCQIT